MAIHYDQKYYEGVYAGFQDQDFARRWALGCAIVGEYDRHDWRNALEFGAGLGQNLEILNASNSKWAVDVSDQSRDSCRSKGFEWRSTLDEVPDGAFEFILSRHSLEHVPDPYTVLKKLKAKAKENCELVLVVPLDHETAVTDLHKFDEHRHLFSWSPETLKNLLMETGWWVKSIDLHSGRWFRRMTNTMLPRYRLSFNLGRWLVTRCLPMKSGEIIAHAWLQKADSA
jgi:SAM-dependent methyltransferase